MIIGTCSWELVLRQDLARPHAFSHLDSRLVGVLRRSRIRSAIERRVHSRFALSAVQQRRPCAPHIFHSAACGNASGLHQRRPVRARQRAKPAYFGVHVMLFVQERSCQTQPWRAARCPLGLPCSACCSRARTRSCSRSPRANSSHRPSATAWPLALRPGRPRSGRNLRYQAPWHPLLAAPRRRRCLLPRRSKHPLQCLCLRPRRTRRL